MTQETPPVDQGRMSALHWPRWLIYVVAVAMTAAMLLIRMELAPSFGDRPLLILLVLPIVLSSLLGGFGPGLASTLLAGAASAWFMPPESVFRVAATHDFFQWTVLIANGVLISILAEWLHRVRRQAEAARHDLAERMHARRLFGAIAESSTDVIFAKDLEGRYLLFNREAGRITGKTAEEALNRDDSALFPPAQAEMLRANDRRVIAEDRVDTYEETVATTQGERTFLATKGPLHDDRGRVIGLFGVSRDITERRRAELALQRERDLNQRYLDTVQTIMVALDGEGRVTMINRKGCELLGYAEEELFGRNWFEICLPQPEGMDQVYPVFLRIMAGELETSEYFENAVLCRDGRHCLIAWRNAYFSDDAGNIIGTLSSGEDISERKAAEETLRRQAEELKARNAELERFNCATVGRELDMIELKRRINELSREFGREAPYSLSMFDTPAAPDEKGVP